MKLNKNQVAEISKIAAAAGLALNPARTGFAEGQDLPLLAYLGGLTGTDRTSLVARLEEAIFCKMDAGSVPHTPAWLVSRARQAPEMKYVRIALSERAVSLSLGDGKAEFPLNRKTNYPETLAAMIAAAGEYKAGRETTAIPTPGEGVAHWRVANVERDGASRGNDSLIVAASQALGVPYTDAIHLCGSPAQAGGLRAATAAALAGWTREIPEDGTLFVPSAFPDAVVVCRSGATYVDPQGIATSLSGDPTVRPWSRNPDAEPFTAVVDAVFRRPA